MRKNSFKKILPYIATGLLAMSIMFFIYQNVIIPKEITSLKKQYDVDYIPKVTIIRAIDYIAKGSKIRPEQVEEFQMLEPYILDDGFSKASEVAGKIAAIDIYPREQLVNGKVIGGENLDPSIREIDINVEKDGFVMNSVKAGSLVDIEVHYGNGKYDTVISKIKVLERESERNKKDDGNGKENETSNKEFERIKIRGTEEQRRNIRMAEALGKIKLSLYVNETQPSSVVTFNMTDEEYNKLLEVLKNNYSDREDENKNTLDDKVKVVSKENSDENSRDSITE
ncbi:MAG: hypothetical protein AB7G87_04935 [Clostridia bacterium]